ncbi:MAG: glutathione S-transferase [Hyphomonadaceae bacterium]|nr:MAG: glutathione S-transferase-like protein [Caulobacteraceae bacterium]MBT9444358.1 glutathione S-transferase [Hyphomonadaceae bacterium]TPW06473.1 MAG: glutathione S-transferase-like protein [Alphaproteobacteria bacterium]
MKLYTGLGPNPRVVRLFMAEKGITLPLVVVDLVANENRGPAHTARNPAGQLPTLELDDGSMLAEITAICEYLEEKHPTPALIGATPEERANVRMWTRRVDLNVCEPMTNGFRFAEGLPLFKDRVHCIPAAADDLKQIARGRLTWLDGLIAGRDFIAGPKISLADLLLFAFLEFGAQVGQPLDPANRNLAAWYARMAARPSVTAV